MLSSSFAKNRTTSGKLLSTLPNSLEKKRRMIVKIIINTREGCGYLNTRGSVSGCGNGWFRMVDKMTTQCTMMDRAADTLRNLSER